MNPDPFLADLFEKPARLAGLSVADAWGFVQRPARILLLGMGSSHYANLVAAARLRSRGIDAVAELASSDLLPAVGPDTLVVAVSASAGSAETLDAVDRLGVPFVAMANKDRAADRAGRTGGVDAGRRGARRGSVPVLPAHAGPAARSGVSARRVAATAAGGRGRGQRRPPRDRRWVAPELAELLLGAHGTHVVAPARRISSAYQSALMLREGPRLPAVGCETGDWSHVDVYLTKTTDYRMLLLGGSRWEPQLLDWTSRRGSTVVAVGTDVPGAAYTLRYRHDDNDDVRLLTETLVAELVAAHAWLGL